MSKVTVAWHGDTVKAAVRAAEQRAVDAASRAAAERARSNHPGWKDVTGRTSASIEAMPSERTADGVRGLVGSSLPHFIFLEIGHHGRKGDRTLRRAATIEAATIGARVRDALPADYRR